MKRAFFRAATLIFVSLLLLFNGVKPGASAYAPGLTRGIEILYEKDRLEKGALPGQAVLFSHRDFLPCCGEKRLDGIYLKDLPDHATGCLSLGGVSVEKGAFIPSDLICRLAFNPCDASVETASFHFSFSPDDVNRTLVIRFTGQEKPLPTANDINLKTYRNVACFSNFSPLHEEESVWITSAPKKGALTLQNGGAFIYTPGQNVSGSDSFRYCVKDSRGNESESATVSIQIIASPHNLFFTDCSGASFHNDAIYACEAGILHFSVNEQGLPCFRPDEAITEEEQESLLKAITDNGAESALQAAKLIQSGMTRKVASQIYAKMTPYGQRSAKILALRSFCS